MRVQCGQGHWFDDDVSETCDHDDAGDVCGYPAVGSTDSSDRIRAYLRGEDPALAAAPSEDDDLTEVEYDPAGPAAARAAAAEAKARWEASHDG